MNISRNVNITLK